MRVIVCNEKTHDKEVVFKKNFWSGKLQLYYDGKPMSKIRRNRYTYEENGESNEVTVYGNEFKGIYLLFPQGGVTILRSLNSLEIILSVIPLILVFFGGAVGGAIGGLAAAILLLVMRKFKNPVPKIVLSILVSGVAIVLWYIIASVILEMI